MLNGIPNASWNANGFSATIKYPLWYSQQLDGDPHKKQQR